MAIGPSKGVNPLNEEPLQTEHVALRMAQRRLTEQEIDYVMLYGKPVHFPNSQGSYKIYLMM